VLAGTGFNQVVEFVSDDKKKNRTIYGALARAPVRSISLDRFNDRVIYTNAKSIFSAYRMGDIE
jgi:hypothetical protein